ncbi:MAG: ABC transporter substrate binding protein [PVC group bacterium]
MVNRRCILPLLILFILTAGSGYAEVRAVRIGLVTDGPYYYGAECWEQFKKEIAVFEGDEFRFFYPPGYQLVDGWKPEEISANCRRVLDAGEVDIVVGMGLAASSFFASQTDLGKPVILFGDLDFELLGLEDEAGHSRIRNLTFQVDRGKIRRDVESMARMARGKEVTVLVDREIAENIQGLEEMGETLAREAGIPIRYAYYAPTVEETMNALPPSTAFIYLTPTYQCNTREKLRQLIEAINRRKIPTFALEGRPVVELGALAGLYAGSAEKIAKNNALKLYEILKGEAPEAQSVYFRDREEFAINLDTARRIGYSPDFDLMMEARFINEEREEGPLITLRDAVRTALDNNLSYQIARRELEEEEHAYRKVLANLFPQIEATADYQRVDSDRAKSSLGIQPRWQSQGGVSLEQLIFDYSVWKSVSLARLSVVSAERDLEIARLDTARDALLAYFSVLQARELLRIQKENLDSTRNHLGIARVRLEQETGSREDVLRLESEYKGALTSVIGAAFDLQKTSLQFNETLNRPQEEPFRLERISPEEGGGVSVFSTPRTGSLLANQADADLLRTFLVEAGNRYSPEVILARLNVEISEEDLTRARAGIWSPTVGARAEYNRRFGEEVWNPDNAGGGEWGDSGPYPDDNEWSLVGYVRLPLWKGGSNWAEMGEKQVTVRKASQALSLQEQGTALAIRSAFFDLAASSTNWELDRDRERIARETLELVTDKYRKGTLPLIDLLDAQSQNVNAQASAVSSFYTSITDLITLERQTGFLEYVRSAEEIEDFLAGMERHMKDRVNPKSE